MGTIIDAISERLGNPLGVSSSGWYRFHCVFCPTAKGSDDIKGHLNVHEESGHFKCFRCDTSGSVAYLLRRLGINDIDVGYASSSGMKNTDVMKHLVAASNVKSVKQNLGAYDEASEILIPSASVELFSCPPVQQYAADRKLTPEACRFYGLKAWRDMWDNLRLLIPDHSADDGTLVCWTARAICNSVEPKYYTAAGADKSKCVWNLNRIDKSKPIYVCEGFFSARACGANGVSIYGKSLSLSQAYLLKKHSSSEGVRVVLDGDAKKQALKAANLLVSLGVPTGVAFLPEDQDPDSMDPYELSSILDACKPVSPSELSSLFLREGLLYA